MPILSDIDLARTWPDSPHIGPASIDLHLGDELQVWPRWIRRDPRIDQSRHWRPVSLHYAWTTGSDDGDDDPLGDRAWVLEPGHRYLATTRERLRLPDDCAGQLSARSSWGRDGLAVIQGPAGFIDPGYHGTPTLELSVVGSELVIWPGARCLQLVVYRTETPAVRPYGHPSRQSKYQGDQTATPSRTHREVVP
jgi:dCTP deaminase